MVEQADLVRKRDKEEEMGEERAGPGGGEGKMEKKNTRIDKNLEEPAFDLPLPLPRPLPLLASFCPPPPPPPYGFGWAPFSELQLTARISMR